MNKVYSMLGLAARSRNVVSGEFSTEKAVKSRKAHLVMVAEDASGNTGKKFCNMCAFYKVPLVTYGTKAELGHAMGKEQRASLAVTNPGLAQGILKNLEEQEQTRR